MKRVAIIVLAIVAFTCLAAILPGPAAAADAPADRVVVMYFHRTKRCPTCLKMGAYSEQAVKGGFTEQVKDGKVEFHYIDFQNEKNAKLAKAYGISGPALVVAKIADNKVKEFENLKDIWARVGDKTAFVEYVQENVTAGLK